MVYLRYFVIDWFAEFAAKICAADRYEKHEAVSCAGVSGAEKYPVTNGFCAGDEIDLVFNRRVKERHVVVEGERISYKLLDDNRPA